MTTDYVSNDTFYINGNYTTIPFIDTSSATTSTAGIVYEPRRVYYTYVPQNIRGAVEIFGIEGTMSGSEDEMAQQALKEDADTVVDIDEKEFAKYIDEWSNNE